MGWGRATRGADDRPDDDPEPPRRADWRLLLAAQPRNGVLLVGLGPADRWRWLVDDGWTARVLTDPAERAGPVGSSGSTDSGRSRPDAAARSVDAVVLGPRAGSLGRGLDDVLGRAVEALHPGGEVVVLGGPTGRVVRALRRLGVAPVRRYLAVPDAVRPDRLIPLDHPGGLRWLAGPPPALTVARPAPSRRLLRRALRRIGSIRPTLFGSVVVVAGGDPRLGSRPLAAGLLDGIDRVGPADDTIVVTSGFDEGSRAVALPLRSDGRPAAVVKAVTRPAYRSNAEREHRLLAELAPVVSPPGLVPAPLASLDRDGVVAVVETYAGRWTASAVLNEQRSPGARRAVLDAVLRGIDRLAVTPVGTGSGARSIPEEWGAAAFEVLIARWFDQLDEFDHFDDRVDSPDSAAADPVGRSAARAELRAALDERCRALAGRPLPVGLRHHDLGPWNVVFADRDRRAGDGPRSPITMVDWELAPPRVAPVGPLGADHLYFVKYWLHVVLGCRSIEDERSAFAFLASGGRAGDRGGDRRRSDPRSDPRAAARSALASAADRLGVDRAALPLLEAHVWAEAACYHATRRRSRAGRDGPATGTGPPGGPAAYLDVLAREADRLLAAWPLRY